MQYKMDNFVTVNKPKAGNIKFGFTAIQKKKKIKIVLTVFCSAQMQQSLKFKIKREKNK